VEAGLNLLLILQARRRCTAAELAQELGVSERTIYRDLEALGAAGVPVYGVAGRGGGYALVEGYQTKLTGLTGPEAERPCSCSTPPPSSVRSA
jgi:predicted DNA-binding transcriptional regulator YafY